MKITYAVESDASLLALIALGDDLAMAAVYDRHCSLVYTIALQILGDPLMAEDCIHEVFMALWRVPDDFRNSRRVFQCAFATYTWKRAVDLKNVNLTTLEAANDPPTSR